MNLPLCHRTPPHTKIDESVLRVNSRGERYFNALLGVWDMEFRPTM